MHIQLREFIIRFASIVVMSVAPVIFTAFVVSAPVLEHLSPGHTDGLPAPYEHMT